MVDCGTPKDPIFNTCEEPCATEILFDSTSASPTSPTISVRGTPKKIIVAPGVPEGHLIRLERSYSEFGEFAGDCQDDNTCPDMPWAPVDCDACECGCGGSTYLYNAEDPSSPSSRVIQNSIWLKETGEYRLVYETGFNPPLAIIVYAIEDCLPKTTSQPMLNKCLPCPNECPPSEPVVTITGTPTTEEFIYCVGGVRKQKPLRVAPICDQLGGIPGGTPIVSSTFDIIDPGTCEVRSVTVPEFECCDTVYPIAAQQGGGICVEIGPTTTGQVVWQSRDGTFLEGAGTIGGNPPGPLTISDTSPYDEPSLLVVVMRGVSRSFDIPGPYAYLDDESVTFRLGETLAVPRPDYYDNPLQTSISQIEEGPAVYVDAFTRYERGNTPGTMHYQRVLSANEAFTLYGQWWLTLHINTAGGVFLYHGEMDVEGYILRGVTS